MNFNYQIRAVFTNKVTLPEWIVGLSESIDFTGTVIHPQKSYFLPLQINCLNCLLLLPALSSALFQDLLNHVAWKHNTATSQLPVNKSYIYYLILLTSWRWIRKCPSSGDCLDWCWEGEQQGHPEDRNMTRTLELVLLLWSSWIKLQMSPAILFNYCWLEIASACSHVWRRTWSFLSGPAW